MSPRQYRHRIGDRPRGRHRAAPARGRLLRGVATRVAAGTATAALLVLSTNGIASAYWRAPGAGSGRATQGTVTLTAGTVGVTGLYPGASQTVSFPVSASGATGVKVVSLTTTGSQALSGCAAGTVTFTVTDSLPVTVVSGTVLHGTVTMSSSAANACQGLTLTLPITVNGRLG